MLENRASPLPPCRFGFHLKLDFKALTESCNFADVQVYEPETVIDDDGQSTEENLGSVLPLSQLLR